MQAGVAQGWTAAAKMWQHDGNGPGHLGVRVRVVPLGVSGPSVGMRMYLRQAHHAERAEMLAGLAHRFGRNMEVRGVQLGVGERDRRDDGLVAAADAIEVAHLLDSASPMAELIQHLRPEGLGHADHAEGLR